MRLAAAPALAFAVTAVLVAPLAACKKSTTGATATATATAKASAEPPASSVTIVLAPRAVGTKWTETDDYSIEVEMRSATRSAWFGSKRRHRTRNEVLEVDAAGQVTKLAVSYLERADEETGPGAAPAAKRSAVVGKAFVVAVVDGKVVAARADGGRVTEAELRELSLDQRDLGKPPAMDEILARTWQVGAEVQLTAAELERLVELTSPDDPRPTAVSFMLREVRADEIELAMRMRMESRGRTAMIIDGTGRVVLDVRTGWPRLLTLGGAVNGTASGTPISGNMKTRSEMTLD